MELLEHIKPFAVTFVALFPVVNPIGDAPIFLALTSWYPGEVRKTLARKIASYGFALLATSFLFGNVVLDFFGISLVVVRIAGRHGAGFHRMETAEPGRYHRASRRHPG